MFLGPYDGRSVALLQKLKGVLTNPNCEYGANYVAIHTLAQWSKCSDVLSKRTSPTRQAMLLEMEGSPDLALLDTSDDTKPPKESSGNSNSHFYDPKLALIASLKEWFIEFSIPRRKPEHYKPVKDAKSVAKAIDAEQMVSDPNDFESPGAAPSSPPRVESALSCASPIEQFTFEDLCLLVDYFYLPHQHGEQALSLLREFCWLKENAPGYGMLQSYEKLSDGVNVGSASGVEDVSGVEGVSDKRRGLEKMEPDDGLRSDGEATCESPLDEGMNLADVSCVSVL